MEKENTKSTQYSQTRAEIDRAKEEIKRVRILGEKIEEEYTQKSDANEKLEQIALEKYQRELKKLTKGDYDPILCFHDEEEIFSFAQKHHVDPVWFYQQLSLATSYANRDFFYLSRIENPQTANDHWQNALYTLRRATLHHNRPYNCTSQIAEATLLLASAQALAKSEEKSGNGQKLSVVYGFLKRNTENLANFYYIRQNPSFDANDI